MRLLNVLLFALTLTPPRAVLSDATDILDIVTVAKDIVIWIGKAWHIIDQRVEFSEVPLPLLNMAERKLFSKIDYVTTRLNQLSAQFEAIGTNTNAIMLNNLPERIRLELRLNDFLNYQDLIDISFQIMQKYVAYQGELEKSTLSEYADSIVSHGPNSVITMIESVYVYLIPTGKGINNRGILHLLSKTLKVSFRKVR